MRYFNLKAFQAWLLVLAVTALAGGCTSAQPYTEAYVRTQGASSAVNLGQLLDDVDLEGAAAQRTLTITNEGGAYAYANLEIDFDADGSATDFSMTCTSTTREATTPTATRLTCAYDASGFCDNLTATRRQATAATADFIWQVSVAGFVRTDCAFTGTSAAAGDDLSVWASLVAW
jgi:hypothetical protein